VNGFIRPGMTPGLPPPLSGTGEKAAVPAPDSSAGKH
jgi:hypothetical protein